MYIRDRLIYLSRVNNKKCQRVFYCMQPCSLLQWSIRLRIIHVRPDTGTNGRILMADKKLSSPALRREARERSQRKRICEIHFRASTKERPMEDSRTIETQSSRHRSVSYSYTVCLERLPLNEAEI